MAAALGLILLRAGGYYARSRPAAQSPPVRDPALVVLLSVQALERSPDTRFATEQVERIPPFLRALKDVPVADAEAAAVIVRAVVETFTLPQQAALEETRRRFQAQARGQGRPPGGPGGSFGPGAGPPPGGGPSALTEEQRAQLRARAFDETIRHLERRLK